MQESGARETAMRRLQQMEMWRQRKSRNVWKGQPGDEPGNCKKLARIRPSRICPVSHGTEAKYKKQVEQFLSFADEDNTGARRGRRGRHELQPRTTGERRRGPHWRASCSSNQVREVGRTEACSVVESSGRLEKTGSDTLKATVAENDLVWSLLGDGEKQETSGWPSIS